MESNNTQKDIFLGFRAYSETDVDIFKGREQDTEYLYNLVINKDYVVCYAESGEGKSSLVEAGLMPKLRTNRYFPVRIAFTDEEFNDEDINFDETVKTRIMEAVAAQQSLSFVPKMDSALNDKFSNDLWWFLRHNVLSLYGINFPIVLIFDQFEEVINYPKSKEWTSRFFEFLEKISTDVCPQNIMEEIEEIDSAETIDIVTTKDFKAVFSIRTEYIGELDYWCMQRYFIPDLKHNRFCLKPLTLQGADEVMKQYDGFDEELRERIKTVILRADGHKSSVDTQNSEPRISALILSVVCTSLYHNKDKKLNAGTISDSIENFYNDIIENCNISIEERNTIASVLVDKDKRVRVASDCAALEKIDFNRKYKDALLKNRLIKKSNVNGVEYIELVHDSLIDVVKKHKEEALQKELRKKRRRTASIFTLMSAVIILFVIMMVGLKKNEKNLLITQAKFIAAEVDNLLNENKTYEAMKLLNYVANNNKESLKVPEFKYRMWQLGEISLPKEEFSVDFITPNCKWVPNECMLLTYDANVLKLLSYENNQTVFEMEFNDTIDIVEVSDNSEYIILSLKNNEVILCSTASREMLYTKKYDDVFCISTLGVSPDGEYIYVSYCKGNKYVKTDCKSVLISTKTGKEEREVYSAHLSGDGKFIVEEKKIVPEIELRSVYDENLMIKINDEDGLCNVIISPDGKYILTQDLKKVVFENAWNFKAGDNVKLWSFEDKKCLATIKHDSMIKDSFFTSDGNYIITSTEKMSKITSVKTGECVNHVLDKIVGVDVENKEFVTLSEDKKTMKKYGINDKYILNVQGRVHDFNMNKSLIVTAMYDEEAEKLFNELWSLETDECIYTFEGSNFVRFSPGGKYIAVCRLNDGKVDVHSMETFEIVNTIDIDYYISDVNFSLDERLLLLSSNKVIEVWSMETNQIVKRIEETVNEDFYHYCPYRCLFTPDNDHFLVERPNGVMLYSINDSDIECFQNVNWLGYHRHKISLDGKYLALNYEIISVDTRDTILSLAEGDMDSFTSEMVSVEFSADCRYIVASYGNSTIKVWSLETGECISVFEEDEKDIRNAYFTKDGKSILCVSEDMVKEIPIVTIDEILFNWSKIFGSNPELTEEENQKYYLN